jgi:PTH1 family peptidyl-tRNA hydrolase
LSLYLETAKQTQVNEVGARRWLFVGLGNPGERFRLHRHNVGYQCISLFAQRHRLEFHKTRGHSRVAEGVIAEQQVILSRPQTFMNESGIALRSLLRSYRLKPSQLLVVADDLDLPIGRIRLRARGSAGGQRGLLSIINEIGTQEFARLRVGVGRPEDEAERGLAGRRIVIDYVLRPFSEDEERMMATVRERVADALDFVLTDGLERAMGRYNQAD